MKSVSLRKGPFGHRDVHTGKVVEETDGEDWPLANQGKRPGTVFKTT